ncbi:MAG TPA: ROK family protein [Actinomycetota bacterium]|jgi:glucokinase
MDGPWILHTAAVVVTVGVDGGGTKVLAGLVDERGTVLQRVLVPTDPDNGTGSVLRAVEELLGGTGGHGAPAAPVAIGVGVAGYVHQPEGRVVFSANVAYAPPDVKVAVSARFGLPVVVENDANAACWGERTFGAGRGCDEMVMVTVGTGVGGGIVTGGRLLRGLHGYGGEIGHMTIVDGGPLCACGQHGCVEALASGSAIARMAREAVGRAEDSIILELAGDNPSRITGALVTEAARADDELAIEVLARAGRALGTCFANLTNLLDPEIIVVGGGAAEAGWFLTEPARLELVRRVADRREPPELAMARLGSDAGMVGAASLALEALEAGTIGSRTDPGLARA